ncbi:MAG: hypothetical protein Q4F88_04350 [Eubacteriales bacterium]|nr:hypothetical protein [Eubacteriales bacterium]
MKNKKFNIFVFLSIIYCMSVTTFSIGVNDTSNYVTRSEFNTTISNINSRISTIDSEIEHKITNYFATNTLPYEGSDSIDLILNQQNGKYTIKQKHTFAFVSNMSATATTTTPGRLWTNNNTYQVIAHIQGYFSTTAGNAAEIFGFLRCSDPAYDIYYDAGQAGVTATSTIVYPFPFTCLINPGGELTIAPSNVGTRYFGRALIFAT